MAVSLSVSKISSPRQKRPMIFSQIWLARFTVSSLGGIARSFWTLLTKQAAKKIRNILFQWHNIPLNGEATKKRFTSQKLVVLPKILAVGEMQIPFRKDPFLIHQCSAIQGSIGNGFSAKAEVTFRATYASLKQIFRSCFPCFLAGYIPHHWSVQPPITQWNHTEYRLNSYLRFGVSEFRAGTWYWVPNVLSGNFARCHSVAFSCSRQRVWKRAPGSLGGVGIGGNGSLFQLGAIIVDVNGLIIIDFIYTWYGGGRGMGDIMREIPLFEICSAPFFFYLNPRQPNSILFSTFFLKYTV